MFIVSMAYLRQMLSERIHPAKKCPDTPYQAVHMQHIMVLTKALQHICICMSEHMTGILQCRSLFSMLARDCIQSSLCSI